MDYKHTHILNYDHIAQNCSKLPVDFLTVVTIFYVIRGRWMCCPTIIASHTEILWRILRWRILL